MKAKLKRLKNHYDLFIVNENNQIETWASTDNTFESKLSKQNCDEIFGGFDVEKLAEECSIDWEGEVMEHIVSIYKEGFNKAMELNKDKVFTLQDMRKAYKKGVSFWITRTSNKDEFSELLTSIQQPSEIEVEIEMREDYLMWKHSDIEKMSDCLVPKLDSEGCLILKKI